MSEVEHVVIELAVIAPPIVKITIVGGVTTKMMFEIEERVRQIATEQKRDKVILYIDVKAAHMEEKSLGLISASYKLKKMTQFAVAVIDIKSFMMRMAFGATGSIATAFGTHQEAVVFLKQRCPELDETLFS
jgi:hypothetical protein